MRAVRDVSMYLVGLIVGYVVTNYVSAWWLVAAAALLVTFHWLDIQIRGRAHRRGYGEGWDKGHEYGYENGRFNGYGKGFNDALQKRSES